MEIFERNCRKTVSIYGFYSIGRKKSLKNMNKDRVIISLHRKPPMTSLSFSSLFEKIGCHLIHSNSIYFINQQNASSVAINIYIKLINPCFTITLEMFNIPSKNYGKDYSCYQKKKSSEKKNSVHHSNNHFDQTTVTQRMTWNYTPFHGYIRYYCIQQSCLNEWFTVGKIYIQQKYYDILLGIELFYKENDSKINIIFRMVTIQRESLIDKITG